MTQWLGQCKERKKRLRLIQNKGMINRPEFLDWVKSLTYLELVQTMKNKEKIYYLNYPCGFDIETSSFRIGDEKMANMYIWQFGMCGIVTYGRTWEQFVEFFNDLSYALDLDHTRRMIIYDHNLGYDFQFFRKHLQWEDIFLLEERKPISATTTNGFEFRDSLKLAGGVSLATVGKNLQKYKVEKLVGDLDYSLIRGPETPLTPTELAYCENDIRVIMSYIQEKIESDGDISQIPLTNTGYVRRYCREACFPSEKMEDTRKEDDGRTDLIA